MREVKIVYDYLFKLKPVPGGYYAYLVDNEEHQAYGTDALAAIENLCVLLSHRDMEVPYTAPMPNDLDTYIWKT